MAARPAGASHNFEILTDFSCFFKADAIFFFRGG